MAIAPPIPMVPIPAPPAKAPAAPAGDALWRAPLVPVALALTAGIVLDRYASVPLPISLLAAVAGIIAWLAASMNRQGGLSLVYLFGTVAALGTAYHHWFREVYAADDIGEYATADPRPVKLRGVIAEEPAVIRHPKDNPLKSYARPDPTVSVLEVSRLSGRQGWQVVTGRAELMVVGEVPHIHVGDEVEVVGRLVEPSPPANPGEPDYASFLRDQRIRAVVQVHKSPEGVTRLAAGSLWSVARSLALLRGWGRRTLQDNLPDRVAGVGVALLLGETSLMSRPDWEKYRRTGVIHVLAISGQHLVVLGAFLWLAMRCLGIRRRRGAWFVALFLLAYSLLTGGRPAIMRSAVMVCAVCGGLVLRRPSMPANTFALAWIVVALLNPTDLFSPGCLLSFLAVAVLYWGNAWWFRSHSDPLDQLVEETHPAWLQSLRWLGRLLVSCYFVTLVIWLVLVPLVANKYQMVSPIGVLLGPPAVLLTSVALLAGFLLLLFSTVLPPLVPIFAWVTGTSLLGCEYLVDRCEHLPLAYAYVGDIPDWWVWVSYLAILAALMLESMRSRWRWVAVAGLAWICLGLLIGIAQPAPQEFRCTFLAVGHGGCAVLQTPDGRTLLYDAGTINGPDVTRRQIAPFLWSQGIRRVDEVFLSHADLDHYNGLRDLSECFAIGQVSLTPTFQQKLIRPVRVTLDALKRYNIPVRIIRAGDILTAGDVTLQVLHPPRNGPEGKENFRSLVLLVRHAGHSLLLTGDLEGPGMEQVLRLPLPKIDVLMAPHHGSRAANTPALVAKVRPRVVLACQGPPRGATRPPDPAMAGGVPFLGTWPNGAITVRSGRGGLVVETFLTRQRLLLRSRDDR